MSGQNEWEHVQRLSTVWKHPSEANSLDYKANGGLHSARTLWSSTAQPQTPFYPIYYRSDNCQDCKELQQPQDTAWLQPWPTAASISLAVPLSPLWSPASKAKVKISSLVNVKTLNCTAKGCKGPIRKLLWHTNSLWTITDCQGPGTAPWPASPESHQKALPANAASSESNLVPIRTDL